MKYLKPLNETDLDAGYRNEDPENLIPGSKPPAEAFETLQRELVNLIIAGGLEPKGDDLTQVKQAVDAMIAEAITAIDVTTFAEKRQFQVVATLPEVLESDVFYFVHEVL